MAHELEILENGTASMVYVTSSGVPWHGLGQATPNAMTADEAIRLAGLDWEVELAPLFGYENGEYRPENERVRVRRSSDGRTLGIVSPDYKRLQNRDAFGFFDSIVDSGEAKYETAGSLFGGRRIWLTAKLGNSIQIAGEDAHDVYLLLTTSHDGSRKLRADTTIIRAVCYNTVTMAQANARTSWSMSHKVELTGKLADARRSLELTFKAIDSFEAEVEKLLAIEVNKDRFEAILRDVLPKQKRQLDKNVGAIMSIYENEPTVIDTGHGGTGWGAYNAFTFWTDNVKASRSPEARMTSLMGGFAAKTRDEIHTRILALA